MGKNLYIGNLSYSTTREELSEAFSEFGEVTSCKIITDQETGRSKGFAFVEMADDSAAEAAISKLNGFTLNSRELKVNEARPRNDRPSGYNRNKSRY